MSGWGSQPFAGSAWVTNNDAGIARRLMQQEAFGAIAYSPSTGRYGWSYGWQDQSSAESNACLNCGPWDSTIVVWGENACLALALSDDGSCGGGWGSSPRAARKFALKACAGKNPQIKIEFNSRTGRA